MTLAVYSDSGATTKDSNPVIGATIYLNADITSLLATTSTTVKLEVFNNSDVLQDTPLDTTHNFPANTNQNIKTDINSNTAPSVDLTGYTAGQHYVKLTVSGTGVYNVTYEEDFVVTAPAASPVISSPAISSASISQFESVRITATLADTTDAVVVFEDGSDVPVYAVEMVISGGVGTATTEPLQIPVAVYSAGQVIIRATNAANLSSEDATLALTVTSSSGLSSGVLAHLNETVRIYTVTAYNDDAEPTLDTWNDVACRVFQKDKRVRSQNKTDELLSTAQILVDGSTTVDADDVVDLPDGSQQIVLGVDIVKSQPGVDMMKVILV